MQRKYLAGALAALAFFLGGCTDLSVLKRTIATKGAAVADNVLKDARWVACEAASIGSVRRTYGVNTAAEAAYNQYCAIGQSVPFRPDSKLLTVPD